jgi:hypothetical protein
MSDRERPTENERYWQTRPWQTQACVGPYPHLSVKCPSRALITQRNGSKPMYRCVSCAAQLHGTSEREFAKMRGAH